MVVGAPFTNRSLDRRTLLRGVGAALALPWLSAMAPARGRPRAAPRRALFVFLPNGVVIDAWKPPLLAEERLELPFLLEPLQSVRHRLTVISGLAIDGGRAHGDGPGDHARAAASFLTCAHPRKTGGADLQAGVSIDQVLARAIGGATPFASLELGVEQGAAAGSCDSGYACAYSNNISWRSPATPVAKETEPRAVFARLFGDPDAAQDRGAAARERQTLRSVLDAVHDDAQALWRELGAADRGKLDDYLTAVRELEQRLERLDADAEAAAPGGEVSPAVLARGPAFAARVAAMYELLALAFATDRTRVATLMLGNAGSNRSHAFLGVSHGHHDLSHHGKDPQKLAALRLIDRWRIERFAAFLERLQGCRDGDSDLLTQSLIVLGAGISDGDRHNHDDLPVLLAGAGGGAVRGDRHVAMRAETPMADLYVGVAQAMGVELDAFADSTGALAL